MKHVRTTHPGRIEIDLGEPTKFEFQKLCMKENKTITQKIREMIREKLELERVKYAPKNKLRISELKGWE
jgi:DNA-binding transcriptional regulator YiaG